MSAGVDGFSRYPVWRNSLNRGKGGISFCQSCTCLRTSSLRPASANKIPDRVSITSSSNSLRALDIPQSHPPRHHHRHSASDSAVAPMMMCASGHTQIPSSDWLTALRPCLNPPPGRGGKQRRAPHDHSNTRKDNQPRDDRQGMDNWGEGVDESGPVVMCESFPNRVPMGECESLSPSSSLFHNFVANGKL